MAVLLCSSVFDVAGADTSDSSFDVADVLVRLEQLERAVADLRIENKQQQRNNDAQLSTIDNQKATITELEGRLAACVGSTSKAFARDRERTHAIVAMKEPGPSPPTTAPVTREHRLLESGNAKCVDPGGPRLIVDGVCSCSKDVIANNISMQDMWTAIQQINDSVHDLVVGTDVEKCPLILQLEAGGTGVLAGIEYASRLEGSVDGQLLYATQLSSSSIIVVNVTNRFSPTLVSVLADSVNLGGAWGLAIGVNQSKHFLFVVATTADTLSVVNITEPRSPRVVGTFLNETVMNHPLMVTVSPCGKFVFVTGYVSASLVILNVEDPTNPSFVGFVQGISHASGVAASHDGSYVYVSSQSLDSVTVINVTDPTKPLVVGSITNSTILDQPSSVALAADGNHLYVTSRTADSFAILSVQDPTSPYIISSIVDATNLNGAYDLAASPDGRTVFVVSELVNQVVEIDVSVPAAPVSRSMSVGGQGRFGVTTLAEGIIAVSGYTIDIHQTRSVRWCGNEGLFSPRDGQVTLQVKATSD